MTKIWKTYMENMYTTFSIIFQFGLQSHVV